MCIVALVERPFHGSGFVYILDATCTIHGHNKSSSLPGLRLSSQSMLALMSPETYQVSGLHVHHVPSFSAQSAPQLTSTPLLQRYINSARLDTMTALALLCLAICDLHATTAQIGMCARHAGGGITPVGSGAMALLALDVWCGSRRGRVLV